MTTDNSQTKITVMIEQGDEGVCRTMWLSVIVQSLSDALTTSNKHPFGRNREEALKWFAAEEGEGSDFATICNLAGVNFRQTQERINLFLNDELEALDFRCIRKGKLGATESRKTFMRRARKNVERRKAKLHITPKSFRKEPISTDAANHLALMTA